MNLLLKIGAETLETVFFIGAVGTILVLILSAMEDFHTITDRSPHD